MALSLDHLGGTGQQCWWQVETEYPGGLEVESPDPDDRMMKRARESWWIYFGKIPVSKIVECIIEAAI
jgi:hypothetical protein